MPLDVHEHLAELARYHGVEFDQEDLQAFEQALQQGAGPADMEEFVSEYVAQVYESGDDDDDDGLFEDDDDVEDDDVDHAALTEDFVGRLRLAQETLGRSLTLGEAERIAGVLDAGGDWDGDIERVVDAAGIKSFDDMNHGERTAWMVDRVSDLDPPKDLEVPVADDGSVDFDSMSRGEINEYMAARAEGAEFEDVVE